MISESGSALKRKIKSATGKNKPRSKNLGNQEKEEAILKNPERENWDVISKVHLGL